MQQFDAKRLWWQIGLAVCWFVPHLESYAVQQPYRSSIFESARGRVLAKRLEDLGDAWKLQQMAKTFELTQAGFRSRSGREVDTVCDVKVGRGLSKKCKAIYFAQLE